jgi:predicted XRE-type DNA-binding protein
MKKQRYDSVWDAIEPSRAEAANAANDKRRTITRQRFNRIWDAIEPSRAEAANTKARAATMIAIQQAVSKWLDPGRHREAAWAHPAAPERSATRRISD